MKRIINRLGLIFLIGLSAFIYNGCISIEPSLPVEEASLIGKTKDEVLVIAFEKTPDPHGVGIHLVAFVENIQSRAIHLKGWCGFGFKTIEDARNKTVFLDCNEWLIFKRDSLLPFGKDYYLRVKFENGKLISTERWWISDGF